MKKVFLMFLLPLCPGVIAVLLWTGTAHAKKIAGPGDGYANPDDFGVSGHGPALSYTDNGDGTFTDNNTKLMWEIKDQSGGVHDVDNLYAWSATGEAADGTLFTDFLDTLNNSCRDDETVACVSKADCTVANGGPGGRCGFAGFQDWCIPNVKRLQSIVDYTMINPASSVPGATQSSFYWSSTTNALYSESAWGVEFGNEFGSGGGVFNGNKVGEGHARAVRPCS